MIKVKTHKEITTDENKSFGIHSDIAFDYGPHHIIGNIISIHEPTQTPMGFPIEGYIMCDKLEIDRKPIDPNIKRIYYFSKIKNTNHVSID